MIATASSSHRSKGRIMVWLGLSLAVTLIYAQLGLQQPLGNTYVIHDDVRSHVFWMRRFFDPDLFPNDLIADYFQSVAPHGYTTLYRLAAAVGVDPVTFNKILPLPLMLLTMGYGFFLCLEFLAVPLAGFLTAVFLNQTLWAVNDVASATPRAFLYPLLLAFLYYVARRSLFPCLVTILLQGLFYPQCLFLSSGVLVLRLIEVKKGRVALSRNRQDYWFCLAGLGAAALMLAPYALKISDYGPVATAAEARTMPTFQHTGRKDFFHINPWNFWFCNDRSAVLPLEWCRNPFPIHGWFAVGLVPILIWGRSRLPLVQRLSPNLVLLPQLLLASLGMFFIAHALLFRLHLPNRYSKHSLRILIALAGAIALTLVVEALWCWAKERGRWRVVTQGSIVLGLTGIALSYPWLLEQFPAPDYVVAEPAAVFEFFAAQPKDILVGSLADQANNVPSLSQRSILTASEIANPYHLGYFRQIDERTNDLMAAQYSFDGRATREVIEKYGLDFLWIEQGAFNPDYIESDRWLRQIQPLAGETMTRLAAGDRPALAPLLDTCTVLKADRHIILGAPCLLQSLP
ncbi:MAG: hypothetical protein VKK04_18015 [Synechococcales bacterium]|nr:hypothetical protein [Synechococcales bacterium]